MVDHQKQFQDVFVGMPSSMKDTWILWLLNLYQKTTFHGLFNYEHRSQNGICPYIFGDKDYPFLPWLMIPHKHVTFVKHTILEVIFNKHYGKKDVLQLTLQLKFWIAKHICNSFYLYAMSVNKQVAWVTKM
jgi:hypothetical protein